MILPVLIDSLLKELKLCIFVFFGFSAIERLDKRHDLRKWDRTSAGSDFHARFKKRSIRITRHSIGFAGICVGLVRAMPRK